MNKHIVIVLMALSFTGLVKAVGLSTIPLIKAAQENKASEVTQLLAQGADVNQIDTFLGITALDGAATAGNSDVITLLLNAGANVDLEQARDLAKGDHHHHAQDLIEEAQIAQGTRQPS